MPYKTILVTGGTGYIGSWVVKYLLENNYTVRLCVRNKNNPSKTQHLRDIAERGNGNLELWEADLLKPGSFDDAAKNCDAVIHMASPFTLRYKDPKADLLDPALEGTRNVLNAATKAESVKKVVLTSSIAAVHGDNIDMKEQGLTEFTEEQFNCTSSLKHQPYSFSKVMAEKEAWSIAKNQNKWKLVVVNPSFVMGPALSSVSDSESLNFMKEMLTGKYHMGAPDIMFGFVDVRDVALAHILSLENDEAEGRHIISAKTMSIIVLAQILKNRYGKKFKLPLMKAPKMLIVLMAPLLGLSTGFVTRNVGYPIVINNNKSIRQLGMSYTPIEKTMEDMVEQMVTSGMLNQSKE